MEDINTITLNAINNYYLNESRYIMDINNYKQQFTSFKQSITF